ncbi:Dbl homology domain-containing protein [Halteromyces radiatus]|uniref:Dbl homology domain-containing protein n=1 Tax=Halteromyces radiatus TaxID=101107 RepID=UPI00221F92EA|nr:Dbl homology domain-containing protein [Halteromyces radiatus]KAI8084685.1 Dbl homology domain-containing protein [Halteromyces radiatus]
MMELISTEETYLDDLLIIKTKFMDPLIQASQQSRPIINYRDIQTIFAFIPQLISLSSTLVQRLNSAQHDNDDDDDYDWIGYIFSDLESSFDVYIYYAVNFEKVRKCLAKIDCDALCYQILQDSSTRRKETKRMGLYDFLITPIQRITRYCLLLKDLQKNSTKSILVDRSLKCLSALACAMNEIQ